MGIGGEAHVLFTDGRPRCPNWAAIVLGHGRHADGGLSTYLEQRPVGKPDAVVNFLAVVHHVGAHAPVLAVRVRLAGLGAARLGRRGGTDLFGFRAHLLVGTRVIRAARRPERKLATDRYLETRAGQRCPTLFPAVPVELFAPPVAYDDLVVVVTWWGYRLVCSESAPRQPSNRVDVRRCPRRHHLYRTQIRRFQAIERQLELGPL